MSRTILLPGLAALAAAMAAALLLILRRWRHEWSRRSAGKARIPGVMRTVLPLAVLVEPVVPHLLPARRAAVLQRQLEALGHYPGIDAVRWQALRIGEALLMGSVALLALPAMAAPAAAFGYLHGALWLKRQRETQQRRIARELPAWLDLMTVCIEAGATLTSGLRLIVGQAPPGPLRDYFEHVLREIRGGRARAQAFCHVADIYAMESLSTLAGALAHAESSGMSLGEVLRTQAAQRTAERFSRAEKLAMQAPVKMLGPLILCIFPCTFIVIGVPIAVRLKEAFGT